MKIIIQHRLHQPSAFFSELVSTEIESLRDALHIDEARVLVERRVDSSPAFRVSAHLVTPGPDVLAEAVDHTLRAALQKLIAELESRIEHRHDKRTRRLRSRVKTATASQFSNPTARS